MKKNLWQCRYAPSLGALEDTPENVWSTREYENLHNPTVFFGLYGLPDFYTLWRHVGRKAILWAGTDIKHFENGYWLDTEGSIRMSPAPLARWIKENCESYVENHVEREALEKFGIQSKVVPSFLGNVNDYKISYKWSERPKLYTSVSGNNFEQYGWHKIYRLAEENPEIDFFLYGNSLPFPDHALTNIFVRGRIPKEDMNEEIKDMQGALRLTEFDGFSEIIAKSLLWGQWPVSLIEYPHTLRLEQIVEIKEKKNPNTEGRDYYISVLNKYPWNQN